MATSTVKMLFLVFILTAPAFSEAVVVGQDEQARAITSYTINVINQNIASSGPSDVKELVRITKIDMDEGELPNAYSYRTHDASHIGISRNLVLLFYYVAEINVLNNQEHGKLTPCSIEFYNAIRKQYSNINEAFLKGHKSASILAPEDYAKTSIQCSELTNLYPFPHKLKIARDSEVVNAIGFVYLHELGHLKYKHSPMTPVDFDKIPDELSKQKAFFEYMCQSRHHEEEADNFAADTLVDLGFPFSATSVSLWQTFTATSGLDPSIEVISTHPNGYSRYVNVANRVRNRINAKGLSLPPGMDQLINEMNALLKKISEQLPVQPMVDNKLFSCK